MLIICTCEGMIVGMHPCTFEIECFKHCNHVIELHIVGMITHTLRGVCSRKCIIMVHLRVTVSSTMISLMSLSNIFGNFIASLLLAASSTASFEGKKIKEKEKKEKIKVEKRERCLCSWIFLGEKA